MRLRNLKLLQDVMITNPLLDLDSENSEPSSLLPNMFKVHDMCLSAL